MPLRLYVAPNGDDRWTGTRPTPNRARTDGPLATLQRALQIVAERKPSSATLFLRGGTYWLTEPIVLTPDHSHLTLQAYRNEKPILSGGTPLLGWREATLDGKRVWAITLPADLPIPFRQLFVNGRRAQRARYPTKGYLKVAELPDSTPDWFQGHQRFRYHPNDLPPLRNPSEGEVVVFNRWVESRLPIQHLKPAERLIEFAKRSVFQLQVDDLYFLEGVREALTDPGEWYLDTQTRTLYYIPRQGERIQRTVAVVPRLSQLVRMLGEPEKERYIEGVVWRGITFAHTEWSLPTEMEVGEFPQAAVGVPGAFYAEDIRNCRIEACEFRHLGGYALELGRGCQRNFIERCTLTDLGAGGIKLGEPTIRDHEAEQTFSNTIQHCQITDGGKLFASAVGIWIGQSAHNRIAHCEIADFYYTGISIGWTWGYGRSLAGGNRVEFNHVHHIGKRSDGDGPVLSDMGGIYTLGIQTGTHIHHNRWHDIAGYRYGGWGIYFDEGSTGIVAEYNLVYRTTHGGFHQHYGRDNLMRNNIFAYARDHQLQASRPEPHRRFRFERNIVIGRGAQWLAGGIDTHMEFENNLYWREDGSELRFGQWSWEEWRAQGMDRGSQIADPQFVNPQADDFRLKPTSPALKMGFEPFVDALPR